MKRTDGMRFVLEFPLKTEIYQEHILEKRFENGRNIYNALANVKLKAYKEMIKTKKYRTLIDAYKNQPEARKDIAKQLSDMRKQYGLSEFDFIKGVKYMQHHFKDSLDSFTAQSIAGQVWKAFDKLLFGNGETIHFKKKGEMNSLQGKNNKTGIRFFKETHRLDWKGLSIPVIIDTKNDYEMAAIEREIAYCRILKKIIKGKTRYSLQIVFKGEIPLKFNKQTGELKRPLGKGDVGLFIGVSTVAIASENEVKLVELANRVENIEKEKEVLLQKMDRSRRATNPDNYNEDGTIKKSNKRMEWHKSKRYIKYQYELKELYRKQAAIRKYQHECLSNEIIALGDRIIVEDNNYTVLAQRAKKTEVNEKTGKYKSKKRFGKAIANRAPAMLVTIIERKLKYHDKKLIKIDNKDIKVNEYDHTTDALNRKPFTDNWDILGDTKVHKRLYDAFLLMNVDEKQTNYDIDKCNQRFTRFKEMHDKEVERFSKDEYLQRYSV